MSSRRTKTNALRGALLIATMAAATAAKAINCPEALAAPTVDISADQVVTRDTAVGLLCRGPHVSVHVENAVTGAPGREASAQVDTGSDLTFVDKGLVEGLNLEKLGVPIHVGGGPADTEAQVQFYKATIVLPDHKRVLVRAGLVEGRSYQLLLGRDFLLSVVLTYDGPSGAVTIR